MQKRRTPAKEYVHIYFSKLWFAITGDDEAPTVWEMIGGFAVAFLFSILFFVYLFCFY